MLLDGRIALITGASRGIGASAAKLLARNGAAVAVNYASNEAAAIAVVNEIIGFGGKAIHVQADVTDEAQTNKMFEQVEAQLGKVDTLVLNAGLSFVPKSFMEIGWDEFAHKYVGELKAAFYSCKRAIPSMKEANKGCIIAVSSGLSIRSSQGFIAHSASKAGLNSFMKSMATELSMYGIRFNTVSPGLTITDATSWMPEERIKTMGRLAPMQRVGLPDDMANAILFFASDFSKFITGGYLPVDGGMTML